MDPDALPPDLRATYGQSRRSWEELRPMTTDRVVELHQAACLEAGRELTPAEARALILRQ